MADTFAPLMAPRAPPLVLASASPSRAALLSAAGPQFETQPADTDARAVREALAGTPEDGATLPPADVAEVLARAKAERVSAARPDALVIGADQILCLGDRIFEKPADMEAARETLLALRGRTHELHSALALARGGAVFWTHTASARMTMRDFSLAFLGTYLAAAGQSVLTSVGAYRVEETGIHLFARIDGDHSTILGLPLLPLLGALRREEALLS